MPIHFINTTELLWPKAAAALFGQCRWHVLVGMLMACLDEQMSRLDAIGIRLKPIGTRHDPMPSQQAARLGLLSR